jgi:hypothetical protein
MKSLFLITNPGDISISMDNVIINDLGDSDLDSLTKENIDDDDDDDDTPD